MRSSARGSAKLVSELAHNLSSREPMARGTYMRISHRARYRQRERERERAKKHIKTKKFKKQCNIFQITAILGLTWPTATRSCLAFSRCMLGLMYMVDSLVGQTAAPTRAKTL